jgi:hypothetical protein
MHVKLVLECTEGWRYQEDNRVAVYFDRDGCRTSVAGEIVRLWNCYWDAIDPVNSKLPPQDCVEAHMLHSWCRLRVSRDVMLVNASESYTMDDFAADLEGLIAVPIECLDGEESLTRGKERGV